jgi:cation transport ATPase
MTKYEKINKAFKKFRAKPTDENRTKLLMAVCAAVETLEDHALAHSLVAQIIDKSCPASTIHKSLVSAASQTGVDVGTLGGGITPED